MKLLTIALASALCLRSPDETGGSVAPTLESLQAEIDALTKENTSLKADLEKTLAKVKPGKAATLEGFVKGIPLKYAINRDRLTGNPVESKDRRTYSAKAEDFYVHVEEENLRNSDAYDSGILLRAQSAFNRTLAGQFGDTDPRTGSKLFTDFPKFDKANRFVVMLAVLPPDPEVEVEV